MMYNKNYYREFNKPIRKNDLDDKLLNIFIGVVILALSLLSYGFWDAVFQWISQENQMELSKETKDKLWAATDLVTTIYDLNKKKTTSHDVVVLK